MSTSLAIGGAGWSMGLVALAGWSADSIRRHAPVAFEEPPGVSSHAGLLAVQLTAQRSTLEIDGRKAIVEVYNGATCHRLFGCVPATYSGSGC